MLLQFMDSNVYQLVYDLLYGPNKDGSGFIGKTKKMNGDPTTTVREIRPNDNIFGGAAGNYSSLVVIGGAYTQCFVGTTPPVARTLAPGITLLHLGWICDGNFGPAGNMQVVINGSVRNEISSELVFNAPNHMVLSLQQTIWAQPNDTLIFQAINPGPANVTCVVQPFAFLIGPASQLGLEPSLQAT